MTCRGPEELGADKVIWKFEIVFYKHSIYKANSMLAMLGDSRPFSSRPSFLGELAVVWYVHAICSETSKANMIENHWASMGISVHNVFREHYMVTYLLKLDVNNETAIFG